MKQKNLVLWITLAWAVTTTLAAHAQTSMPSTVAPGAELVEIYHDDHAFFEGPTWDPAGEKLYFTAFFSKPRNQQILRWDEPGKATVWADQTQGINGTFLSREGRLLGAQAFGHRVTDYGLGGEGPQDPRTLLHDQTLHQPNDVCQAPDGTIYFTDPDFKTKTTSAVYRLKDGQAHQVLDDMPLPNGLITSLDGQTLYVGDSHEKHWRAYPIHPDGTLGQGRLFFDPDTESQQDPDGMTIDQAGNLYFTGRGGVWVVTPQGQSLGLIPVPEFCSNVTFGGPNHQTLFLTCRKKVYTLKMQIPGPDFPLQKSNRAR